MRFTVETAAGQVVGERSGSGEPAFVLHGGPGLSDYTQPLAEELATRYATIRYQQRGLEPSTADGPFTVEQHVADAVAVLDGLELESAWLVGHSWGAHLAMHVAVAHADRTLGLVSIAAVGAVGDGGLAAFEVELGRRYEGRCGKPLAEDTPLEEYWPDYFALPAEAPPMPPMHLSSDVYAKTFASVREHLDRRTLERALPALHLPALFVHGRDDPIPWAASAATAELVEDARLEILDGCGHFPWLERPGAIAAAVERVA